ncbi:g5707 [Coccomyxa elongata]
MIRGAWGALTSSSLNASSVQSQLTSPLVNEVAAVACNVQRQLDSRSASTTGRASATGAKDDGFVQQEFEDGLPEIRPELQDGSTSRYISEEEMRQRKNKAVKAWLEHQVGREKLDVVQILQAHHVIVRGGPEEGNKLIKALLEWKQREPAP